MGRAETGACNRSLTGHEDIATVVAFSPKGNEIASGSYDKSVRLWDIGTGTCYRILSGHVLWINDIAYSPQGDKIASGASDRAVRLWDVETGECRHTFNGHTSFNSVVFSPQGHLISSANQDKVQVWDVESGDCLHSLPGHANAVSELKYSPKGNLTASISQDQTLRLWDVESGQCRAVVQDFHGSPRDITWRVTPNGIFLVTGCEDKSVRVWQVIEDGESCRVLLCWSSNNDALVMSGASLQDAHGSSLVNLRLLKQHRAVGEPSHSEASRNNPSRTSDLSPDSSIE